MDYLQGGRRTLALMALSIVGVVVFVLGTLVVMTANIQPV
jgi:hypothetical protein